MINEIRALREKIGSLENQLKDTKLRLSAVETSCTHKWSPIEADHIYHEGYSVRAVTFLLKLKNVGRERVLFVVKLNIHPIQLKRL
jgi:hypothetical protein